MTESKRWSIYKIIVLYCFLSSARACMTLGDNQYIDLILSLLGLVIIPKSYFEKRSTKQAAAIFLSISVMYTMLGGSIVAYFAQLAMVLIPIQLIFLKRKFQIDVYNSLSKWYAILLLASLVWWILWLVGVPLPHSSENLEWQYDDDGFILENYFLFRHTISLNPYRAVESIFRFNGFLLEPGHIGTITSLFLFINKYDLKDWKNKIFLVVIIVSFSAAAFVVSIIGYLLYRFSSGSRKIVVPVLFGILIGAVIASFNLQDNPFFEIIIGKFTREGGAVEGRFSAETQKLWTDILVDGRIIFGVGAGADVSQSAGYKVFLIMNGIVGALLTLTSYWLILQTNRSKLGRYLFLVLVVSFLQRTYCFWDAFLDPFILGTAVLKVSSIKQ